MLDSWGNIIISNPILYSILNVLSKDYKTMSVLPDRPNVLNAFKECNYNDLKVVIIGMDPYPQKDRATGIAFANPEGTKDLSPSLSLIKDRIYKDFYLTNPEDMHFDVTLKKWANQGVLLLNAALTVKENCTGYYGKLWYPFLKDMLLKLSDRTCGIVYMLLGSNAQSLESYINHKTNYVLKYKHPSYYARIGHEFVCDGFKLAKQYIKENNNIDLIW